MSGNELQFTTLSIMSNFSSCPQLKTKSTCFEKAEEKSCLLPHLYTKIDVAKYAARVFFIFYLPCKIAISQNTTHHCNFFI